MTTKERTFDLVLFGATGFTGRLTADYLARATDSEKPMRWAIAGRSRDKLDAIAAELREITGDENPAVRVADVDDRQSLDALAQSSRVLATTVGPYALYGRGAVDACVEAGTDYVDITGEPEFVASVLRDHGERALADGLRIVSCCGFDSIPHDFGAWLTVRQLPADRPMRVEGFVHGAGQLSGGTWQSAVQAFGRLRKSLRATSGSIRPPAGRRVRGAKPTIRYERRLGTWAAPLPTIDPWIVLRSAAALDDYGPDFRYGHSAKVRSLPRVIAGVGMVGGIVALSQLGPTRRWLLSLKGSGEGPDAARRERSRFNVTFLGEALGDDHKVVATTVVEVSGGDPGYGETSKMLAESALSLVHDRDCLPPAAGVSTPVVAFGDVLLERLRAADMRFEVVDTKRM